MRLRLPEQARDDEPRCRGDGFDRRWPGACNPLENSDGDHYFCTPATADLEPVFRQVAAAAIETAHLID